MIAEEKKNAFPNINTAANHGFPLSHFPLFEEYWAKNEEVLAMHVKFSIMKKASKSLFSYPFAHKNLIVAKNSTMQQIMPIIPIAINVFANLLQLLFESSSSKPINYY